MSSRAAAEARGQELRLELPDELPSVRADHTALRRVICELIESAVKYTPDGGLITVSARVDEDEVAISVTDTGRGIQSEDVPHVFDKFYRGRSVAGSDATDKASSGDISQEQEYGEVPGVGVGLYVARRLVEMMNGSIGVESEQGRGSTFTVRLPVWERSDE